MPPKTTLSNSLKIIGVTAWVVGVSVPILFTREQPGDWQEILSYSLIIPILVASFFYGRAGGLLVALISSLVTGSLAIGEPEVLQSPVVQRVLFQIVFFNTVALVTSSLSEREKMAAADNEHLYQESLALLQDLQRARDELAHWNQELEDKVDERTRELAAKVDELNQTNQALEIARQRAEEADQIKSQFLANMSHELRTPLNSIINFAYLLSLEAEGPLTASQTDMVELINNSGRHLLRLINDILDLAKIEAGRLELFFEEVDVAALIADAVSTTEGLLLNKPVELRQMIAPDLPPIRADRTRLRQVFLNLLSNAVKFTDEGHITLYAAPIDDRIIFSVADSGVGIPEANQAKVFGEFIQADGDLDRQASGSGLGLAISQRFVEMHGGRMWLESEAGVGSTFYFSLPLTPGLTVKKELAPATGPDEVRVLVIDDDPYAAEAISQQLTPGYDVVKLTASQEAVTAVRDKQPDVIVLDIVMPQQDGWEILQTLKADPATRDIPVVMYSFLREQQLALSLGADDYLVKPVDQQELRQTISAFLPGSGRVLVVDDDPNSLEIVHYLLGETRYQVDTAEDGREGLTHIDQQRPDIVVLDLMMPNMNGFEVLAQLRANPQTADLPVIVLTAKDLTADERQKLNEAAAVWLQKGAYSPEELTRAINRAVRHGASD